MKKTATFLATLGILLWAGMSPAQDSGYKVIVNGSNSVSSVTRDQVSKLFLKKTSKWADGRSAQPVDLPEGSSVRSRFSKSIHGKSVAAIKAYWQQMVFSGREVPPSEKASVREVVAYVEANAGAIGYVPAGTATGNCKVLSVR